MALPATCKSVRIASKGQTHIVDCPLPSLRPDAVLVRVHAVGMNPADVLHIDHGLAGPGSLVGCDFAGVVEAVGADVKKPWKKGDRVVGGVHGCNPLDHESGAYAEYIIADGDLALRIPDSMGFAEATGLGTGVFTVSRAMYQFFNIPLSTLSTPSSAAASKAPILIYGGSTSTGVLAIQFARLSGLDVIATCSPHNSAYVRGLGAAHVFTHTDAACAAQISAAAGGQLRRALDCIGDARSRETCAGALAPGPGGQYSSLTGVDGWPRADVAAEWPMAYTVMGRRFEMAGTVFEPVPQDRAFCEAFVEVAERLVREGAVRPHRVSVGSGGLEEVVAEGFDRLREGVSGRKIVYEGI